MIVRVLFVSFALAGLAATPSSATSTPSNHDLAASPLIDADMTPNAIVLDTNAPLSDSARLWLSTYGEPLWRRVSDPKGETIGQIIDATCGSQPALLRDKLVSRGLALNYLAHESEKMNQHFVAFIPFCVNTTGPAHENEHSAANQHLPATAPVFRLNARYQRDTQSAHTNNHTLSEIKNFFAHAQPAPETASAAPVEIGYNFMTTQKTASGFLSDESCEGARPGGTLFNTYDRSQFIEFYTKERELFVGQLGGREPRESAVTVGLIDSGINGIITETTSNKLRDEKYFLKKYFYWQKPSSKGIYGLDFFGTNFSFKPEVSETALCLKNRSIGNSCRHDDDDSVQFFKRNSKASHGTKMASLILGGPDNFGRIKAANGNLLNNDEFLIEDYIALRLVNFSDRENVRVTYGDQELARAVGYLKRNTAKVVNMSLDAHGETMPVLVERAINDAREALFISAAGNEKRRLSDVATNQSENETDFVIPAVLREQLTTKNLVVVSAHDRNNKGPLHPDSNINANYSEEFVDFLAPGDCISVIGFERQNMDEVYKNSGKTGRTEDAQILKPSNESGTSVAAAVTSHFAAIIRGLMNSRSITDTPTDITPDHYLTNLLRARLIGGLDYDEEIEGTIWRGRLNPLKAVSVYTDLIELKTTDEAGSYRRVLFDDSAISQIVQWCGDDRERRKLNDINHGRGERIIKAIPNNGDDNQKILFWKLSAANSAGVQTIEEIECPQAAPESGSNVTYSDADDNNRKKNDLNLDKIKDITFATMRT